MALFKRTSVMVIGKTDALGELMEAFASRNMPLLRVDSVEACNDLLGRTFDVFALIVSESEKLSPEDVDKIRLHTAAPIIWGVAPGASDAAVRKMAGVKLVHTLNPAVLAQINELMVGQVFNQEIARALRQCTIEAFSEGFATPTSILQPFVAEVREPLHEVMAFIGFAGPQASGYLSVSASGSYLEAVHHRLLKSTKTSEHLLRSTAGEMVNQVFGRFKAFLQMHNVTITTTFPIVLEGKTRNINYRPGRPSLVHQFRADRNDIFVELCMDPIDKLVRNDTVSVLQAGELQFL